MIGTAHEARLATEDWLTLLAEGSCRNVYLNDAGTVVYKVNTEVSDIPPNTREYSRAERIRSLVPDGVSVPEITMWGDVLAMPFIHGVEIGACYCRPEDNCWEDSISDEMRLALEPLVFDIMHGNLILDDEGLLHIIDLAD